jgi:hypothetical protein
MRADPGLAHGAGGWDRDLDVAELVFPDSEQLRCARVAQGGSVSAREHRCHPEAFPGQLSPSDGIDAAELQRVETAGSKAVPNRLSAEAELGQLPVSNDAVLLANEGPNNLMID